MTNQNKWSNVDYIDLPHAFYSRGIVSPCKRFYVGLRSINSKPNALNWGILDLHTEKYIDGFQLRKEAVAYVKLYERMAS